MDGQEGSNKNEKTKRICTQYRLHSKADNLDQANRSDS